MALFYHSQPLLPLGLPALDDEPLHIAHPPPPEVGLQGRAGCLGSRALRLTAGCGRDRIRRSAAQRRIDRTGSDRRSIHRMV